MFIEIDAEKLAHEETPEESAFDLVLIGGGAAALAILTALSDQVRRQRDLNLKLGNF